jgi:hypothetical protein
MKTRTQRVGKLNASESWMNGVPSHTTGSPLASETVFGPLPAAVWLRRIGRTHPSRDMGYLLHELRSGSLKRPVSIVLTAFFSGEDFDWRYLIDTREVAP